MNELRYISKDPGVDAMRLTGTTYDAVARWVGHARLASMIASDDECWIVEVHPDIFVVMGEAEFRERYAYSRKNNTALAVHECWEEGLDRTRTAEALGLSYKTVDKHFPKDSRVNPDLEVDTTATPF